MLRTYKTQDGVTAEAERVTDGCWINAVDPSEAELERLRETAGIDAGFLRAALDEEETSRIESEDGRTLIIFDIPFVEKDEDCVRYTTVPLGIILTEKLIVTVCLRENAVIEEIEQEASKIQTNLRTRFVLHILLRMSARFLLYLRQIDRISGSIEKQLHGSLRNRELIQLLDLEKSLVYFSTSLKADEITLEKILRGRMIRLYEEDQDLLEDVIIEVKQAIEMSNIYSSILSGTMDAFASVISNNLNIVMKVLTSITIVMAIPTIAFSFYGMNTTLPVPRTFWVPLLISAAAMIATGLVLYKKRLF